MRPFHSYAALLVALTLGCASGSRVVVTPLPPPPAPLPTASPAPAPVPAKPAIPERMSDSEYWAMIDMISEPGGYFRIVDNFTSNERDIGMVAAQLKATAERGQVYIGVGPEQNYTYMNAIRPRMAFIVDIRRQAVVQHLMNKAIFELSKDRADFISLLFSRLRPPGIDTLSTITQMWDLYRFVQTPTNKDANFARIRDHLTKTHGFALNEEELSMLAKVYDAFVLYGPYITTDGAPRGRNAADFIFLTSVTDPMGMYNSFLGSEENYRWLKSLNERNLFVPFSGNFAGPKAIRSLAAWLKEREATVAAFYVSNVEQYLFGDGIAKAFYENVEALPINDRSVFIRPGTGRMSMTPLCPIGTYLKANTAGRVFSYADAQRCAQ